MTLSVWPVKSKKITMKEKMRTDRKDFFSVREEKEISSETIFSKRDEEKVGGKLLSIEIVTAPS